MDSSMANNSKTGTHISKTGTHILLHIRTNDYEVNTTLEFQEILTLVKHVYIWYLLKRQCMPNIKLRNAVMHNLCICVSIHYNGM